MRNRSVVLKIIVPNDRLDSLSRLRGVVEWDLREHVMAHMCVGNVVETMVQERAERSVHSAQSAAKPSPLLRVRKRGRILTH